MRCAARHGGGCDAVATCLGQTVERAEGDCPPHCAGDVHVACWDGLIFRNDCALLGLACYESWGCAAPPSGVACTDDADPPCEGGRPRLCGSRGLVQGPVCADYGLECQQASDLPGGVCVGGGDSCPADETVFFAYEGESCAGEELQACVNGRMGTRDCTKAGPAFHCQTARDAAGLPASFCGLDDACVPPPAGPAEFACDGSVVTFCDMGRLDRVDCRDLGFTGCDPAIGCTPTGFSP